MSAVSVPNQSAEAHMARGQTIVLPGQTPDGRDILSVLLKRTYDFAPGKMCTRAEKDKALIPGDEFWGDPMNSTVRNETDFIPFKLATDVVVEGKAYAPRGLATQSCVVAIKIGDRRKDIRVIGDRVARFVKDGTPVFTEPKPFEIMDLRYERAYGGIDVYSDKAVSYPYPRNPLGCGFAVTNSEQLIENLTLPNLEDPNDLLTPERLCLGEYAKWEQQPFPAGLGWFPKTWVPRARLAGILPGDRVTEQELRQAYAKLVPADQREAYLKHGLPDMNFEFFNGASPGLSMPYLKGGEQIATANLASEGIVSFQLTEDQPRIGLDIGEGMTESEVVIHTVMIRMEPRQVDVVWRASVPYAGRDWLPQMRKMEVTVA